MYCWMDSENYSCSTNFKRVLETSPKGQTALRTLSNVRSTKRNYKTSHSATIEQDILKQREPFLDTTPPTHACAVCLHEHRSANSHSGFLVWVSICGRRGFRGQTPMVLSVAVLQISPLLACRDECLEVSYHSATPHW